MKIFKIIIIVTILLNTLFSQNYLYAEEIKRIPEDIELISSEAIKELNNEMKMCKFFFNPFSEIKWPSMDEQLKHSKFKNYSEDYLIKHNLSSFAGVQNYSLFWIKRILNKEFIPHDLNTRLKILQYSDPTKSKVICRYEINGFKIQIIIKIADINLVITPIDKFYKNNEFDYTGFFKTFFTKGELMAGYERLNIAKNLKIYNFFEPCTDWYKSMFLHFNNKSSAFFIKKIDRSIFPSTGDPWF